jgi:hypothetical protein
VEVYPGGAPDLVFRLEEEGRLRITVYGPGGFPLAGAEVEIEDAFGGHLWPPREDVDLYRPFGSTWLTSARGEVVVGGLRAGVHVVRARKDGLAPFATRVLVQTGTETRGAVVLLP